MPLPYRDPQKASPLGGQQEVLKAAPGSRGLGGPLPPSPLCPPPSCSLLQAHSAPAPLGCLRFCRYINHGSLPRTFAVGSAVWTLLPSGNFLCLEHSFPSFRIFDKGVFPDHPSRGRCCLASFSKLLLVALSSLTWNKRICISQLRAAYFLFTVHL